MNANKKISHTICCGLFKGDYLFPLPPPDGFPVVLGAFTSPLLFAILFKF
jgi:hypothetical protein